MNKVFYALLRGWPCVLIWPRRPASLSLFPSLAPLYFLSSSLFSPPRNAIYLFPACHFPRCSFFFRTVFFEPTRSGVGMRHGSRFFRGSFYFFCFGGKRTKFLALRSERKGKRIGKIGERSFTCWCVNTRRPLSSHVEPQRVFWKRDDDKWIVEEASDCLSQGLVNFLSVSFEFYCRWEMIYGGRIRNKKGQLHCNSPFLIQRRHCLVH